MEEIHLAKLMENEFQNHYKNNLVAFQSTLFPVQRTNPIYNFRVTSGM